MGTVLALDGVLTRLVVRMGGSCETLVTMIGLVGSGTSGIGGKSGKLLVGSNGPLGRSETGGRRVRVPVDVGAGRVTTEVTMPLRIGGVVATVVSTDGTGATDVATVGATDEAADGAGLPSSYATASNTPLGILAEARSCEKVPLSSWYEKELVLLAGVTTALVPLAQANVTAPLGLREPAAHWLHPLQRTSSCQCVALVVVDGRIV